MLIAAALPNVAPNADAGTDLVVQLGAGATLDGAASIDPDSGPTPLSFQWTFVSVPVGSLLTDADLSGATTAAPSFTPDMEGFYLLRLDVSDGDLMDVDQVQVKANVAPVAVDDAFTVDEDTSLNEPAPGVLGNDSDGTSDPLTAVLNTDVSNGTLTLNPNGSFAYTPDTDFQGTDSFTYRANDGTVNSTNLATVTIAVNAVDDPPVAVNDVATVNEDAVATTIAVLANDTDLDGGAKTILAVQNPSANGGTVLITNGGADLAYQPAADYCNAPPATTPDTFTYTLSPGGSTATVSVTVNCVDDPPVAANDAVTINEDASATTIAVLANDPDLDGGLKAITAVQNPSANGGTVLITNGGADLTYQPAADFCNAPPGTTPDTFTYTLSPGGSTATVSVTVNCVNDAPVIANLAGDTLAYTQGDPATPIDQGGDAAATDVDSPDFDTGTLTVSLPGGLVAAEDEIGIRNQGTGVNQIGSHRHRCHVQPRQRCRHHRHLQRRWRRWRQPRRHAQCQRRGHGGKRAAPKHHLSEQQYHRPHGRQPHRALRAQRRRWRHQPRLRCHYHYRPQYPAGADRGRREPHLHRGRRADRARRRPDRHRRERHQAGVRHGTDHRRVPDRPGRVGLR